MNMSTYEKMEFAREYDFWLHRPAFLVAIAFICFVVLAIIMAENIAADKFRKKKSEEFYNKSSVFEAKVSKKAEQVGEIYLLIFVCLYAALYINSKTYFLLEFTETAEGYMTAVYIIFLISVCSAISGGQYCRRDTVLKYNSLFITEDMIYASSCREKGNPIVFKKEISEIKDVIALKNRKGFELVAFESLQIRTESAIYEIEGIIDAYQVKYLIEKRQSELKAHKEN